MFVGSTEIIGLLRSIAWLAGLDELVEAIDSLFFTIEDSIEKVPLGAGLLWPVEWHVEHLFAAPFTWICCVTLASIAFLANGYKSNDCS